MPSSRVGLHGWGEAKALSPLERKVSSDGSPLHICPGGPHQLFCIFMHDRLYRKFQTAAGRTSIRLKKCLLKCSALGGGVGVVAGFPLEVCNHTRQCGCLGRVLQPPKYAYLGVITLAGLKNIPQATVAPKVAYSLSCCWGVLRAKEPGGSLAPSCLAWQLPPCIAVTTPPGATT